MQIFFDKSIEDTANILKADTSSGLSSLEVESRLVEYGHNQLEGAKEKSILSLFLLQFKDFLVFILIIASVVSIALGDILSGIVILLIVILNAILGVYQENKASNALKALKEMASPKAKVIRNGKTEEVASNMIVPGDIVVLEAGDYIPADVRLVESINLKIDESALTGESVPVEKNAKVVLSEDTGTGDRINSAYMSSVITFGRGKAIVTATGMKTQMGNIASMLNESEDETTPLQKKLNNLGKNLGIICLIVCVIIFGLGVMQGYEIPEIFMTAVALAVAAIPEGLTVVVTVILAMGMQEMVKANAIIKSLSAVETLGSTTTICSDKTGTLTQNKMTVVKMFDTETFYNVSGTGYNKEGEISGENGEAPSENIRKLVEGAALCNDALFNAEEGSIIGDPTEGALVVLASKSGTSKEEYNEKHPRVKEFPFDSERKLMSTFHKIGESYTMYTKGAPDELLRKCSFIYKNAKIEPLSEEFRNKILEANQTYASQALRVLGVAFKEVNDVEGSEAEEENLVLIGLLSMIDPPREEAKSAIKECKSAGINVKMITGDHKITASAIGKELGILTDAGAIEGREIDKLSDEELKETVKKVNVFARVSPEHKVRLVTAVKENGEIVAMTGDGVNDAPSLKRADIGIAMGITGTDVSKEAANMILTDDNFASIVKAVKEGRKIYNNIRKVVGFLLSCNIGEILVIFIAMLLEIPTPLASIQLLVINLITDSFPAFALGMEKAEDGLMDVPPRNPKEPIVDKAMAISVGFQSVFLAAGALGSFMFVYKNNPANLKDAITSCFITLVLGELLRAYSARSEHKSIFKMKIFENASLNKTVFFSLVFLFATVYVPFLNPIFQTVPIPPNELFSCLGFAILPIVGGELAKKIKTA